MTAASTLAGISTTALTCSSSRTEAPRATLRRHCAHSSTQTHDSRGSAAPFNMLLDTATEAEHARALLSRTESMLQLVRPAHLLVEVLGLSAELPCCIGKGLLEPGDLWVRV